MGRGTLSGVLQRGRMKLWFAVILSAAVIGAGMAVGPAGAQMAGPIDCPDVMPVAEVQRGMSGTGWTVVEGADPQPFDVEIKGIYPDGIAPGRDMIIIEASGPVIDEGGGIWFGMSGSPVYINNRLVGAVAYGLSYSASSIGGLTPAEDMMDIFDYGDGDAGTAAAKTARKIEITPRVARMMASDGAEAESFEGNSFEQLKLPLSVSGLTRRPLKRLTNILEREDAPFVPYSGATASAAAVEPGGELHAGDNFAAALSYGDLTFAGIGTTTVVCDGEALAFGHPFFFDGKTQFGGNLADSLVIVRDDVWGSYKLATVGAGYGTVDQDRLAGIRATAGAMPDIMPVTSTVTATNTGRTRDGETDILLDDYFPFLAPYHVYANIVSAFDQFSEGTADVVWTLKGSTESGETFELNRTNMFSTEYGIPYYATSEMEGFLYSLFYNDFEEVSFDSLDADVSLVEELERYTLSKVLISRNGKPYRSGVRRMRIRPGEVIGVGVVLKAYDSDEKIQIDTSIQVPEDARREGYLFVGSGNSRRSSSCFYRPARCARETGVSIDSVADLVEYMENAPRNNELRVELRLGRRQKVVASVMETLDSVIQRQKSISVRVVR